MDPNNMKEECTRFANQLISAKPTDLESAVDEFFHPHASLDTDHVSVRGTRQLKKIFKLSSWVRNQSAQLIDEPQYDSRTQCMKFSSTLNYVSPSIPSYVPLHAQLSGYKTAVRWNFTAYVTKNNNDQKFYVSKLKGSRWDISPAERIIPQWIVRPIVTFLSLAFVTIVSFLQAHKGESVTHVASAALSESFAFFWSLLLSEGGTRQAQADKWRGEAVPQLKQYVSTQVEAEVRYYQQAYSSAVDTATKVQSDLEARAKSAGIPVDDYKQRAAQAVSDLAENVEARAKAAGIPVEEYKKQAEAAIAELKKRAEEMGEYLEGKAGEVKDQAEGKVKDVQKKAGKQDKRTRENSNQTSQDKPNTSVTGEEAGRPADQRAKEIRAEFAEVPHTPLGGHDPTAPNAPSFAAAAAL